ncbi:MAG: ABC transporter permease [Candidatus Eisenbacteria bacterium RBG_16_71_46]|nr:MAG: ABC transporter permease [Candidatus Eisenbacteria bacterium RBG_16_71_46]
MAERKSRPNFSGVWPEVRRIAHAHRRRLALGLSLMLVSNLSGMVLPLTSKFLIDEVIGNQRANLLGLLAAAAAGATLVQAGTSFALSQVLGVAAQRAITDMRRSVQRHVMLLPVRYFDSTQTGVLISRIMTDAEGIRNLVGTGLVQLASGIVTAALALGVLFYLNWQMTLVTLVILVTFGAMMSVAFTRLRPLFRERGKINAEVTGRLAESIGGVRIVKSYVAERREQRVFAHGVHRLFRNIASSITGVSATTAASSVIVGVIGVIIIILGGRAMIEGRMTLGDFVMYVVFTGMVGGPLVQIASIGTQITEAFAGLDRIRELRAVPAENADEARRERVADVRGDIEFQDVSFEYDPGAPVLRQVSFRAPKGSTTALVGSSGSGKSTLISLVMAFNRPLAGRVLVDGRDLATLRIHDFRAHLGVVLQDNFLFDGTIAENIAFARPAATRAQVLAAGRIAHCEEFVAGFEKGYDTVVGERGIKLSGGQRQRVAIARAIVADPRILILDEATSSLDSESEAQIQDGLRALRRGRTTFVIAHRLSTIVSANHILVLEHGEIVERGTHAQLLALGGRYRQLYDRQYQLETDRFINPGEDFTPDLPAPKMAEPAESGGRPGSL